MQVRVDPVLALVHHDRWQDLALVLDVAGLVDSASSAVLSCMRSTAARSRFMGRLLTDQRS